MKRILLIDDEPAALQLVQAILEKVPYEIKSCSDPNEAIKILDQESFDCIITDALMPGLDGYQLVRTLRENPRHNDTPILMLTRKRHREDIKKAVQVGVTNYVFKPIDERLLIEKIEESLKKGPTQRK